MDRGKIHIGGMIDSVLKQQGRKHSWLAQQICTDSSNIAKILKKEHVDTGLLMRISTALNHDFFADISHSMNEDDLNAGGIRLETGDFGR